MTQLMDVERYIELVKNAGIEAAYAQRFRCTGKTIRAALRAAADISEGRHLIISDDYPHWQQHNFVERVVDYLHGVTLVRMADVVSVPASGGLIAMSRWMRQAGGRANDDLIVLTEI